MPDRRVDPYVRSRLSEIQEGYLRLSRRILWAHVVQVLVLVATASAFAYLLHAGIKRGENNCTRIHRLVVTLDTIMADSDRRIAQLEHEGTLTHDQAVRAHADAEHQRAVLESADCDLEHR